MKRSLGLCLLPFGFMLISASHAAGSNALEEEVTVLKEDAAEMNSRLDDMLTVSGYTDTEYTISKQPGDASHGFRLHHLSLFFEKRITEQWRFFSEIEYEDAPKHETGTTQGEIFAEAVNLSYAWRPDASFRLGRFFTPAGLWNVDHYPPFVPTQELPLHIRLIFPQIFDGAMAYGIRPLAGSFLKYDLYWGNGEGNTGSKDENSHKAAGLNVGLLLPFLKLTEIGLTYYRDTDNLNTEKVASGAHVKVKTGSFAFQSEYARGKHTLVTGANYVNTGYYAQFMYDLVSDWTVGLRHSFYDNNSATDKVDNHETAKSVFVNYHVSHAIVLKLEHHLFSFNDSTQDNYASTTFSVVGYLGN